MTPETVHFGWALFGFSLGALGVGLMWLVQRDGRDAEQRRLTQANADLRTLAQSIVEDNIGLAAENADLYVRLEMALDAELLSSPNTTVAFIPEQREPESSEWDRIWKAVD